MEDFFTQIQRGIHHILALNAYDHILFLIVLAVPFLFDKWKRVLILVSTITVAHFISIMLVSYDIVSINRNLIDFLLPLMIVVAALYNILTSGKRPQSERFGLIFIISIFFGLLHGFTFGGLLENLVGPNNSTIINILFNTLGFWIGQLIIGFIVLFIGFICQTIFRFTKRDWILVMSAIVVGLLLPMLIDNWQF